MPRAPRADEAGGLYHALNRGNLRADIFLKEAEFAAFERILHEGLEIHQIELYSYQLISNHYHLVLQPLVDGEMSRFMSWIGGTHTMRYHAHYHTSGLDEAFVIVRCSSVLSIGQILQSGLHKNIFHRCVRQP